MLHRLEFVRNVSLPTVNEFIVAEKFREGETIDGIKVTKLSEDFKEFFLGKVERRIPALKIREHKLVRASSDLMIIINLGGDEQAEIPLAHFWKFLQTANRRLRYICHTRAQNGVIWSVYAYWECALNVEVCVSCKRFWQSGRRFLSR